MKQVLLKSLSLCNFKGEKERTTTFNPDITSIMGSNGLGKSRHFDAFIWLLFGKDTLDRKDYEVKTRVNKEVLHKVECSVSGVIIVDGQEITLKRAIIENWVKPHGQIEQVYKGDQTKCWWNETPVSVTEYGKRIAQIIDPSVFKMLTNPSFFVNMKWQLQREQLFNLAGAVSDAEIGQRKPEFQALLDKLSGKSLADYKTELTSKKRRLNEELAQIQPKIDQTYKLMPQSDDYEAIKAELAQVDAQIQDIDQKISDASALVRSQYQKEQDKQKRINELQMECQTVLMAEKNVEQERVFKLNANRRNIENEISLYKKDLSAKEYEESNLKKMLETEESKVSEYKTRQDALRKEWFAENAKVYNGETVCPHCHQQLPEDMVERAMELFNKTKSEKLNDITSRGQGLGEYITVAENRIGELKPMIDDVEKLIENIKKSIAKQSEELATTAEATVREVIPENIPEYVELQKQIQAVKDSIETVGASTVTADDLTRQKSDLTRQHDELRQRLASQDTITKCKDEITRLEAEGKRLAQLVADIERSEYTIEQFNKTKIEECEKRINAMFKYVSFQLFEYTLDGNPVETCIPYANGVPYGTANTASQVNAGIDIINALCKFYGINAPIFIDNRESVLELIPTDSQVINLVVTDDKQLIIK